MNKRSQIANFLQAIIIISLLVYILFNSAKTNLVLREAESFINKLNSEKILVKTLNDMALLSEDLELNEITFGEDNEYRNFKTMIGGKSLLILFYTELGCNVCVDSIIRNMQNVFKRNDSSNIVILASYFEERNYVLFKKLNNIQYPIYNIKSNKLNLPIEENKVPFLFVIDSTLTANCVFIPEKSMPLRTKNYLEIIKRKYFGKY